MSRHRNQSKSSEPYIVRRYVTFDPNLEHYEKEIPNKKNNPSIDNERKKNI